MDSLLCADWKRPQLKLAAWKESIHKNNTRRVSLVSSITKFYFVYFTQFRFIYIPFVPSICSSLFYFFPKAFICFWNTIPLTHLLCLLFSVFPTWTINSIRAGIIVYLFFIQSPQCVEWGYLCIYCLNIQSTYIYWVTSLCWVIWMQIKNVIVPALEKGFWSWSQVWAQRLHSIAI